MLLLASQSPRRKTLLAQLGVQFTTLNVDIDETHRPLERSEDYVTRLAREKAQAGLASRPEMQWSLGADTVVVTDQGEHEQILGKPRDFEHAKHMWSQLAKGPHNVLTAVAIASNSDTIECVVNTQVWFSALSERQMQWYWNTGEPQDKAGGYGIQGLAGQFVKQIKGSYSAVVGLPLYQTSELIKQAGISQNEC
ncbi:Maf family protein [Aliiglaciecola litoralis]|uniref:dTTP/UTP pyrophosphatase n=1 Tax=Aliiglaciecola litoralis TaxID=582857 RepID=A0ABP3WUF7_9ALTE